MPPAKKTFFYFILNGLIFTSFIGILTLCFIVFEWYYTPDLQSPPAILTAAEKDLAPVLVPYYLFSPPRNATIQNFNMPAVPGDTTPAIITTNEYGFRYGPLERSKPNDMVRIFVLGGSVVFYGHTNETTLSGYLEQRLRDQYNPIPVQVINAGITGAISDQELMMLVDQIIDFHPDVVIVFDGFNDFLVPSSFDQRLGYPHKFKTLEIAWYQSKEALRTLSDLPFTAHLWAGSHFLRQWGPHRTYTDYLSHAYQSAINQDAPVPTAEEVAAHLLANWRKMAQILVVNQIAGLFILQPFNQEGETYNPQYDAVEAGIPALVNEFSHAVPPIRYLSFRHVMDEHQDLFYDIVHTYDEGNAYYAQLIQSKIPRTAQNP